MNYKLVGTIQTNNEFFLKLCHDYDNTFNKFLKDFSSPSFLIFYIQMMNTSLYV